MKNTSSKLPYILLGSAVGGAVGYLFMTDSGQRFRKSLMENGTRALPDKIEGARSFLEDKANVVTSQLRGVLDRAKESFEAGQQGYQEAERGYESQVRNLQSKNTDIAANVHKTVDELSNTAVAVQQSFMDPVYELLAVMRGVERGVKKFANTNQNRVVGFNQEQRSEEENPPYYRDERVKGF